MNERRAFSEPPESSSIQKLTMTRNRLTAVPMQNALNEMKNGCSISNSGEDLSMASSIIRPRMHVNMPMSTSLAISRTSNPDPSLLEIWTRIMTAVSSTMNSGGMYSESFFWRAMRVSISVEAATSILSYAEVHAPIAKNTIESMKSIHRLVLFFSKTL